MSSTREPTQQEFWKIFYTSLPELFNDGDNIVSQLGIIIEKCNEHYGFYIPTLCGKRADYESKLPQYIAFSTWLLGQLVRASTIQVLENYHLQFQDWQISILNLLASRNKKMFTKVIEEYLKALKDLIEARNQFFDNPEKQLQFHWFSLAPECRIDSQPIIEPIQVENSSRCAVIICRLLLVVRPQACMLQECAPLAMEELWDMLLSLLVDYHTQVVVAALSTVTTIVHDCGFPRQPRLAKKVCGVLNGLMCSVSNNHSGNCDNNENIKLLLTVFSTLFQTLVSRQVTSCCILDTKIFNTLKSLLYYKSPFLHSGCVSQEYCKLLAYLIRGAGNCGNIHTEVKKLMKHAVHYPGILLVAESLILKDMEKTNLNASQRLCGKSVNEVSDLWLSAFGTVCDVLDNLRSLHNPEMLQLSAKLITATFRTAANLSLHFNNKIGNNTPLVFFNNKFYQTLNILINDIVQQVGHFWENTYTEVILSLKLVVSLQEVSVVEEKEINKLIVFLSVPWLNKMTLVDLSGVNLTPFLEMAKIQIIFNDPGVKADCLEAMIHVGGSKPVALDWRLSVLKQAQTEADTVVTVLTLLPVLLTALPADRQLSVVHMLLETHFSSLQALVPSVVTKLAELAPTVVCALARTTQVVRDSNGKLKTQCQVCDTQTRSEPAFIQDDQETFVISLLEKYLQLRSNKVSDVRKYVAGSLKYWNKHIQEPKLRKYLVKWLVFMKDDNYEVRMALAEVSHHLMSADSDPDFVDLYCEVACAVSHLSLNNADEKLQLSVMATALNISCINIDKVLWPTVKIFIFLLGHPSLTKPSVAQVYLKKMATVRNKCMEDIFFRFQDEICKLIAIQLIHNKLFNIKLVLPTLTNLAQGMGFPSCSEFLESSVSKYLLKHLLPLVVRRPDTQELLSILAAAAGTDLSSLMKNSFQYVYPHVFLFEDKATLDSVCKLTESLTELSVQRLICFSFKVITCELLLYFHIEKAKVTQALSEIKKYEANQLSENTSFTSDNELSEFIQPRFLAVLAYLDSILVSRSGCESTKQHALRTLPDLICLMKAAHITPVRFKVLATLRSALNLYHSFFPELICFAWRAFVNNVSNLGPLLSTIFVSLLPLLEQFPVEISSVFHILVLDNLPAVSSHLVELYFLPDTPPTHQIYTLVQEELAKLRNQPVKDQLAVTLRLATHENSDVRLRGLHKLRSELSLHRQHVVTLITAHDNVDPFILKMLEALILGCRDLEEEVRLASAQCLGEIGALDPGHLPNKIKMDVEEKEMTFVMNSEAFVIRALNEFVRAFQAASHTTTMDGFAFGIQELLKVYNVTSSGVWNKLPDSTKEIISPFRESRYRDLASDSDSVARIPHPVFGSLHATTFKAWAFNWICRLIPTVTDEFVHKVFSVCQLGLKKDLQTLLFFLPYVVLYAILGATKNGSKRIAEEMKAVLSWSEEQQITSGNPTPCSSLTASSSQELPNNAKEAAKTVYQLFDFLYRWLRQAKQKIKPSAPSALSSQYHILQEFLENFTKSEIAEGSYKCEEYTRALIFLEEYMAENPEVVQTYLPSLGKIYYQLHDQDSFRGVIAIHDSEPTAQEMILYHKVTGKLQDAAACYERLGQEDTQSEGFQKAMVQCYLGMDQPSTALQLTKGFLNSMNKSQQVPELVNEQAEAMLSLSMFSELEQLLESRGKAWLGWGWGASLGQVLLHLSKCQGDQMIAGLDRIRQTLVRSIGGGSISHSGYRHAYDVIVRLHILTEVEKLGTMVLKMLELSSLERMQTLFNQVVREDLDERLKLVQPACRVLQPVLCVRRVVLSLAQQMLTSASTSPDIVPLFITEIGNSWLKSIEIARKSGHYQQAYTNILTVEPYKPKGLFVEKAKLLWAKSEPEAALKTLQRGLEHHFPDQNHFKNLPSTALIEDRRLCAQAKLLIAIYNDENVNIDMERNLANYMSAVEVCKTWEKSIVCLAQYKYKYLRTFPDSADFLAKSLEYQVYMINYFGKSLQFGCEYVYQSMPRMLSVWLDFGTQLAQDTMSNRNSPGLAERKAAMHKMTDLIGTYIDRLPTYMFMTAFSQLISRICHPLKDCYKILRTIIIKIIIAYPQQALWMFLSVYKSPYTARVRRCEEVLRSNEIQKEGELCRTISDFQNLFERLIELGSKPPPSQRAPTTVSIKSFLSSLFRLVSSPSFSRVVIPLQKFRTISLPRATSKYHNPFPEIMVYISGMKDDVEILSSLQKPKKITFIGTDGKHYPILCKPNDDLRLDSRMMEFNSIVNMYLQRDPEARDRGLNIRTYSAVPLSDSSGLIEWLPDLVGLRPIISNTYKQMGIHMLPKEYKEICCSRSDPLSKKKQVFLEKLLPRHPPVLREWYLREFSDPTTWYLARTAYVRTLAVMSIVGFMLGLGDRHGENILLDATCGDVVHVDFNCLFNKGERFDWPEKVPFRLTHNLVNAMGPTGVEGVFRHSCEITTRVMRQQIDQLMSVVRPFCYDPLVTWNTNHNSRDENAEMTNEKAVEDIQNIEWRLQGIVKTRNRAQAIPLSVEGQVRTLIAESTSVDNLCQMYIGWGPYL